MHPPMYPPNYEVISKTDWRDTTNLLYDDRSILWACHYYWEERLQKLNIIVQRQKSTANIIIILDIPSLDDF